MTHELRFDDSLREMKRAIIAAAQEAVSKFQAETGISPERIVIETVDVTCAGGGREYALSHVRVDLGDL